MKKLNLTTEKILSAMFVSVFFLYVLFTVVINCCGLDLFYDTDMYADTFVARYMWEAKSIFPDNWIFGNQFFVIQTPVLSALIYGICGDIYLSMKIATTIMMVIIFISFVWMMKPFSSNTSITCGLLLLIASLIGCGIALQYEGQLFYIGVSYYASYMITLLIVIGCFIREYNEIEYSRTIKIISILFTFACGMQSLRQTVVMVAPLLLCSLVFYKKKSFIYTLYILGANLLGVVLIKIINPSHVAIYGDSSLVSPSEWIERFIEGIKCFKKITGIRWLINGNRVGYVGLCFVCVVILSLIINLVKIKNNGRNTIIASFILFFGMMAVIGAATITNTYIRYIYIFPWFVLVGVCGASLIDILLKWNRFIVAIFAVVLCVASLYNLKISYLPQCNEALDKENTYTEKQVAKYIVDNGYKYIYSEWEFLGKVIVNTNADVIGGTWSGGAFVQTNHLTQTDIFDEECNKDAVYMLLDSQVEDAIKYAESVDANFTKVAEFNEGQYQLFVSDKQLMHQQ